MTDRFPRKYKIELEWTDENDYSHSGLIKEIFKQLVKQRWCSRTELEEEWETIIGSKSYRTTVR